MPLSAGSTRAGLEARLAEVAEPGKSASVRLRNGIADLFGDDLVAMWLYGGQLAPGGSTGDVDLHTIVRRVPSDHELERIRALHNAICRDLAIRELDAWYVLLDEARSVEPPKDLNWPVEVHDENWAIKRAHWLGGAYVLVHGVPPEDIVPRPDWPQVEAELLAQLDEAAAVDEYRHPADLTLRLCRVLRSFVTKDVIHFKLDAAARARGELSAASQAHVDAAMRLRRGVAKPGDRSLVARHMATFCREVRSLVDKLPR